MKASKCCSLTEIESVVEPSDEQFARLTAALGHPARIAILRLLGQKGTCICGEIVEVLPLAQSTVSQHLKTLKEAGWISGQADGPRSCYCLNQQAVEEFDSLWQAVFADRKAE